MREEGISVATKRGVGGRRRGRQSVQSDHQAQGGREAEPIRARRERRGAPFLCSPLVAGVAVYAFLDGGAHTCRLTRHGQDGNHKMPAKSKECITEHCEGWGCHHSRRRHLWRPLSSPRSFVCFPRRSPPTFSLPPSSIFPRESKSAGARHKTMLLFGGRAAMNGFVTRWESECLRTIRGIPLLGTCCIRRARKLPFF